MGARRTFALVLIAVSMVAGCATPPTPEETEAGMAPPEIGGQDDLRLGPAPVSSPDDVEIATFDPDDEPEMTQVRRSALVEAAQSYGSQKGYARRAWEIGKILEKRSGDLGAVYSFDRVASEAPAKVGYVMPPVVSRSMDAFRSDAAGRSVSVAEEYLTIVEAGFIAPTVPTWRDYLLFSSATPEEPAKSLLPTTPDEAALFRAEFEKGWAAGVDLADTEIENRLMRLRRDYEGMLQYRRLVSMGMMDRMVLQEADFGVTGSGDEMRIGSRTVKVVSDAEFEADPRRWSVRPVTESDSDIVRNGLIPELGKGSVY